MKCSEAYVQPRMAWQRRISAGYWNPSRQYYGVLLRRAYLGVPIVVGVRFTVLTRARCYPAISVLIKLHMVVVSDQHY
jgi:hypothetical protein